MKIDLTIVMLDENGSPLWEGKKKAVDDETIIKTIITLAHVIKKALLTPDSKDNKDVKINKYELWLRIYDKSEVELSAEDLVLIKECVGAVFTQIIVGQVYRLLEGKESGIKEEIGENQ